MAKDTTVEIQTNRGVQKVLWLSMASIADAYELGPERMQCYGNAVVPQQFFPVFQAISEIETLEKEFK